MRRYWAPADRLGSVANDADPRALDCSVQPTCPDLSETAPANPVSLKSGHAGQCLALPGLPETCGRRTRTAASNAMLRSSLEQVVVRGQQQADPARIEPSAPCRLQATPTTG
jgi:hypothetical protein